jgi:hypothetical protein
MAVAAVLDELIRGFQADSGREYFRRPFSGSDLRLIRDVGTRTL